MPVYKVPKSRRNKTKSKNRRFLVKRKRNNIDVIPQTFLTSQFDDPDLDQVSEPNSSFGSIDRESDLSILNTRIPLRSRNRSPEFGSKTRSRKMKRSSSKSQSPSRRFGLKSRKTIRRRISPRKKSLRLKFGSKIRSKKMLRKASPRPSLRRKSRVNIRNGRRKTSFSKKRALRRTSISALPSMDSIGFMLVPNETAKTSILNEVIDQRSRKSTKLSRKSKKNIRKILQIKRVRKSLKKAKTVRQSPSRSMTSLSSLSSEIKIKSQRRKQQIGKLTKRGRRERRKSPLMAERERFSRTRGTIISRSDSFDISSPV